MLALEYRRSPAKYLAARGATATPFGSRISSAVASNLSPLRLVNKSEPGRPGRDWVRLRPLLSGICGSDLGMLTARSSPYLSPVVSMPFVPGHEVVAETLDELPTIPRGSRVVVDPVLSCAARGLPLCRWCALGRHSRCDRVTAGRLAPGLQTGFCADTGGGWSRVLLAHASQLYRVPDSLSTERAVLVEPLACAVHSVRRVPLPIGASVLIVGAGTVGLLTLLALREFTQVGPVYLIAKHGHQRDRARQLGATEVFEPSRAARALRRATGGTVEHPVMGSDFLLGGVDFAFECSGSGSGLDTALRLVRAGGTVLLSGMPSGSVDLTPLWFRELQLVGSYASDAGGVPSPALAGAAARSADSAVARSANGAASWYPGADPDTGPAVDFGIGTDASEFGLSRSGGRPPGAPAVDGDGDGPPEVGVEDRRAADFRHAIALAGSAPLDGYVDAVYPLTRWREALGHAASAGRLGTVKVAFDPNQD